MELHVQYHKLAQTVPIHNWLNIIVPQRRHPTDLGRASRIDLGRHGTYLHEAPDAQVFEICLASLLLLGDHRSTP